MPFALVVKPLGKRGKLLDSRIFWEELRAAQMDTAQNVKSDFERTVATWDERPTFDVLEEMGPDASVLVGTDDLIYKFLDEGTAVRYATMTPDFSPKTRPGQLDGRPGSGGVLFISTKHPRPGIQARNFTKLIEKRNQSKHERRMEQAIDRALRKMKV